MMTYSSSLRLILLIPVMMASACTSSPSTNFYVLDSMSTQAGSQVKTGKSRMIGLGPVTLPALVERKQLITRTGANTIQIANLHQWAAPLKENITQTLAENLAKLLANDLIKAYPWSAYGEFDYRILIDIVRFDITRGQSVDLEANWAIMTEINHTLLTNGQSKISRSLTDTSYSGAVQALSSALDELSRQLAATLDSINQTPQ